MQGIVCSHSELVALASGVKAQNWHTGPRALIWMSLEWFRFDLLKAQ